MNFEAIKAVGDWELDVTPIPFHSRDSDGQWFDEATDIMEKVFKTPLVIYQHGVKSGGDGLQEHPEQIGRSLPDTLTKQIDGWHIRVLLDATKQAAARVMDSIKSGKKVAVSSDSIAHLARLEVGGKMQQYSKNRPGRIAVWPLAGFSLWDLGEGNARPANWNAVALPAMKAMYRDAGLLFPDVDTTGVSEADKVKRRAEIRALQQQAKNNLQKIRRFNP